MDNLDFGSLSDRETEILELAIEGLTDQQIGNRIDISASTVNSYWVRIRGKLGHLSRTELVSRVLQQRALRENQLLKDRIRDLETEIAVNRQSEWNAENADLLRASFESLPEATLIFGEDGCVLYASERAQTLFGYSLVEVAGKRIFDLFRSGDSAGLDLLGSAGDDRVRRIGVDSVLYGREKTGRTFRAVALIGEADHDGQRILSCLVRPFTDEVDMLRRRASVVVASH